MAKHLGSTGWVLNGSSETRKKTLPDDSLPRASAAPSRSAGSTKTRPRSLGTPRLAAASRGRPVGSGRCLAATTGPPCEKSRSNHLLGGLGENSYHIFRGGSGENQLLLVWDLFFSGGWDDLTTPARNVFCVFRSTGWGVLSTENATWFRARS